MSEKEYQFATASEGAASLADDPRIALFATCIASQQKAGFQLYIDAREVSCPTCKAPGFNTGWGYWQHTCGAEILADGDIAQPCDAALETPHA